ncbi:hypothetical protein RUND412_009357, partial [Rhizina undulata]
MPPQSPRELLTPEFLCRIGAGVAIYNQLYIEKEPCRTSPLSGKEYIEELLVSNARRIREVLRMPLSTFECLREWMSTRGHLSATPAVSVDEQYFNAVLEALLHLYRNVVQLPLTHTPPEIYNNTKLYPYFRDCLGAID